MLFSAPRIDIDCCRHCKITPYNEWQGGCDLNKISFNSLVISTNKNTTQNFLSDINGDRVQSVGNFRISPYFG